MIQLDFTKIIKKGMKKAKDTMLPSFEDPTNKKIREVQDSYFKKRIKNKKNIEKMQGENSKSINDAMDSANKAIRGYESEAPKKIVKKIAEDNYKEKVADSGKLQKKLINNRDKLYAQEDADIAKLIGDKKKKKK